MNVLHIATIDRGGAFKAAERFHQSLLRRGINSRILVRTASYGSEVERCFQNRLEEMVSKGKNFFNRLVSRGEIFRDLFGTDISTNEYVQEADVLVLHWFNSFLSVKSLEKLFALNKPMVFMMHDMWLFTGGCHVAGDCKKYRDGCGACPLISSEKDMDISYQNFRDKEILFEHNNAVITGPSLWIVECAKQSPILKKQRVEYIPNMIDTQVFRPVKDRDALRKKYGLPEGKKIILFGAADRGTGNRNKGFAYLSRAVQELDPEQYHLVIFGNTGADLGISDIYGRTLLGYVEKEAQMAEIYNLANVYVTPSLQESFGFTVCEALACGTPVVAFPVGGILDQIVHEQNGYLAKLKDVEDLKKGIIYCIENENILREKAREGAKRFSFEAVGDIYAEFLQKICEEQ